MTVTDPLLDLRVDPISVDQSIDTVLAMAAALVAGDAPHVELAEDVVESDSAFTRDRLAASCIFLHK